MYFKTKSSFGNEWKHKSLVQQMLWQYILEITEQQVLFDNLFALNRCFGRLLRSRSTFKKCNFQKGLFFLARVLLWDYSKGKSCFFNKNNAFKWNASFFCFFMFFCPNVFQVKLDNILFLFKFNLTSHQLSDNQIPSALFAKLKKKHWVNTADQLIF